MLDDLCHLLLEIAYAATLRRGYVYPRQISGDQNRNHTTLECVVIDSKNNKYVKIC